MDPIDVLRKATGEYAKWALKARQEYIKLRLRQDPEIRKLYDRAADRVAAKLKEIVPRTISGHLRKYQLEQLEKALREEAYRISQGLQQSMEEYIERSVEAGSNYSEQIVRDMFKKAGLDDRDVPTFFKIINRSAIEACWARTKNGLYLSDRIWEQGQKFRNILRDIIQEAVATGTDAVEVARAIEKYVKVGSRTLARDYPNMMKRMKKRVPKDLCYEALRLARTEIMAAFGEGTIAAARMSPSYVGVQWILSDQHPQPDICDSLAEYDEGLGKGVYRAGLEPPYPAHPNCMCILVPIHEEIDSFVTRLRNWVADPTLDPDLENWYQNIYKKSIVEANAAPTNIPEQLLKDLKKTVKRDLNFEIVKTVGLKVPPAARYDLLADVIYITEGVFAVVSNPKAYGWRYETTAGLGPKAIIGRAIGHKIDFELEVSNSQEFWELYEEQYQKVQKRRTSFAVSKRAYIHPRELFAEGMALYLTNPDALRKLNPPLFSVIKRVIKA